MNTEPEITSSVPLAAAGERPAGSARSGGSLIAVLLVAAAQLMVALDATLVRVIIMPAVLQLTGRANWWFPRGLRRAVPDFLTETEPTGSPA